MTPTPQTQFKSARDIQAKRDPHRSRRPKEAHRFPRDRTRGDAIHYLVTHLGWDPSLARNVVLWRHRDPGEFTYTRGVSLWEAQKEIAPRQGATGRVCGREPNYADYTQPEGGVRRSES